MLLKSIELKNIRSYISQKIDFPTGTVLLSGDIGSGKSTILLAVEFALFGILPGELSGNALLRNGETRASVELNFEVNKKDIIVFRSLKKSKESVMQGNGYVVVDGIKKDMTPTEIKTEVFNLLGYPSEMLSKSKNMIYRYTVYTPQEDMKKIIQENSQVRLDILRRVFDIDKYKRIQDNTAIYLKSIKEKQKLKAGMISDLEEKKKSRSYRQRDFTIAEKKIQETKPVLDAAKIKTENKQKNISEIDAKQKKLSELKNKLALKETEIQSKTEHYSANENQIKTIEKEIKKIEQEINSKEVKEITSEELSEKNKKIILLENEIKILNSKKTEYETDKKRSQELKKKITSMDNCPTCFQIVDKTHKQNIQEKENEKIQTLTLQTGRQTDLIKEKEKELTDVKKELEDLRKYEKEHSLFRLKKSELEKKQSQTKLLSESQQKINMFIQNAKQEKQETAKEIKKYLGAEKELEQAEKELIFFQKEERKHEIEYNRAIEKKENMKSILEEIEKEIESKEKTKKELEKIQDIKNWMQDYFLKLVETIEKQVMTRVYYEFNELMQTWFDALVEDEAITCRLEDSFTPLVVQNGFEIEVSNLSGGEKTACALAYRLALNKVINGLITSINTQDLLILDEPTDGFSSEQLDKMREVLEQLGIKQIIIVSHESKVESFVDEIIKISKNEHVSEVE